MTSISSIITANYHDSAKSWLSGQTFDPWIKEPEFDRFVKIGHLSLSQKFLHGLARRDELVFISSKSSLSIFEKNRFSIQPFLILIVSELSWQKKKITLWGRRAYEKNSISIL